MDVPFKTPEDFFFRFLDSFSFFDQFFLSFYFSCLFIFFIISLFLFLLRFPLFVPFCNLLSCMTPPPCLFPPPPPPAGCEPLRMPGPNPQELTELTARHGPESEKEPDAEADDPIHPDFDGCVGRVPLGDQDHREFDGELLQLIKSKFTPAPEDEGPAESRPHNKVDGPSIALVGCTGIWFQPGQAPAPPPPPRQATKQPCVGSRSNSAFQHCISRTHTRAHAHARKWRRVQVGPSVDVPRSTPAPPPQEPLDGTQRHVNPKEEWGRRNDVCAHACVRARACV